MEPTNKTLIVLVIVGIMAAFALGMMLTDAIVTTHFNNQIDYGRRAEQYMLDNTIKACEQQGKQTVIKGTQYDGNILNFDVMCK